MNRRRELANTVLQDNPPPADPVALWEKWRFGMLTVGIVLLLSCIWWLYPTFLPLSAPGPAPAPEKNTPAAPGNIVPPPAPAPSEKIREPIAQNRPSSSKPAFENITFTRGDGDTLPLELFDGDGAAGYFGRLDAPGKPWRTEALWYSGLGYLLTGDREKAKAVWEKALKLPETAWRKKAREGLRQLKQ